MLTHEILSVPAAICPDRTAIIFEGESQSFTQLDDHSSRLADSLLQQGIKAGDRVAMLQVNTPEVVAAYFACAKMGAVFVPLDFRARVGELTFRLQNSGAKALFMGERYLPMVDTLRQGVPTLEKFISLVAAASPDMVD